MKVLDLFCGAGGAAMGYYQGFGRRGVEIVGVDIKSQKNYPFEFVQYDAIRCLEELTAHNSPEQYDFIHASPPCQRYSTMTKRWNRQDEHPDFIPRVRELLKIIGLPYVIENVPGSPLIEPVKLCGSMFGLGVWGTEFQLRRHRMFEASFPIVQPECNHSGRAIGVYGHSGGKSVRDGITFGSTDAWREAMRIGWMTGKEMAESIPPAYTRYIAEQWRVSER